MSVKVLTVHQMHFPRDLSKMAVDVLSRVPEKYTAGLNSVLLIDRITRRNCEDATGMYVPGWQREAPHIEIAVATLYRDMPQILFFVPFVAKFWLAQAIYHEIGHHYQTLGHMVKRGPARELLADTFSRKLWRQSFKTQWLFLQPTVPLIMIVLRVRNWRRRLATDRIRK